MLPPALGIWRSQKLGNDSIQGAELTGSFTVTAGEYVTDLHGTLTANAETSCGTGTIKVPGKIKIIHGSGSDEYGNYNLYAVGVINVDADPIVQPDRVTLLHNGKKVTGSVQVSFVLRPPEGHEHWRRDQLRRLLAGAGIPPRLTGSELFTRDPVILPRGGPRS